MPQTIYLAADHAGFERKEQLKRWLTQSGQHVEDLGAAALDAQDDYPQYAFAVAEHVTTHAESVGILICGNGQGVCVAANKVRGARAVSAWSPEVAKTTRNDDHANILCLPGRFLDDATTQSIVDAWLQAPVSTEDRHERRLKTIADYEMRQ